MDIHFILEITNNKFSSLQSERELAFQQWDMEKVLQLEKELEQTKETIQKLETLI